jgi:aldehyde dehydrogenase (NAD+)
MNTVQILKNLDIQDTNPGTSTGLNWFRSNIEIESCSPINGKKIAALEVTTQEQYEHTISKAREAFLVWRAFPAPQRGEIVRQFGNLLRLHKEDLGALVSLEMGKSLQEGLGEVQEMIDICDFAVGLSRQLYGLTMHSERPEHRMYEQWHPLGITGIISAFNFPVAVWCWNSAIAWVCGDVCIWKASEKAPLCAVACQKLFSKVMQENGLPEGLSCIISGDYKVGEWMTSDARVPLISATGSIRMGKQVGAVVAARLGRSLLELGGNNAIIITPDADLDIAVPAVVFGALGTAGQRCTSTRRIIVQKELLPRFEASLKKAYAQIRIGNPLDSANHMGPLIDTGAVETYLQAIQKVKEHGGSFIIEGQRLNGEGYDSGCYVSPTVALVEPHWEIVQEETFAPLLYVISYNDLEDAIAIQNGVKQGLSSAIMTLNMREAERFLSAAGSDCGIANVNIGTSGAEIGGAFGGEKETGGGRESGSDAWKAYMRRQTNTINYSRNLPLAQGIKFEI